MVLFPHPVVVDMMLQVARGMEFLHSQRIYVGDLNPTNVSLKSRNTEGYFHVKVSGFGLTSTENHPSRHSLPEQNAIDYNIWYAPEVLAEKQQHPGSTSARKYTEKADVYSFGMLCFELLTGKLPFEDGHLQGDKMIQNIRAGGRPLFPSLSPKYLVNLTKRCWHADPNQRPSFSSICRVLRYIKKFLVMNPYDGQPAMHSVLVDYFDMEVGFLKNYLGQAAFDPPSVSQIPFQMFSYRLLEKEKSTSRIKLKNNESVSEAVSDGIDETTSVAFETLSVVEDPGVQASEARTRVSEMKPAGFDLQSVCNEVGDRNLPSELRAADKNTRQLRSARSEPPEKLLLIRKPKGVKIKKTAARPKSQTQQKSRSRSPPGLRMSQDIRKSSSMSSLSQSKRRSGIALGREKA